MIEDILNKSITLIVKCKVNRLGSNTLNNHIKGALNRFAETTKNLEYERMQCIDNGGNVLFERDGEENKVSWTRGDMQEALSHQLGDLINEHNHPTPFIQSDNKTFETPTLLSKQDVSHLWEVSTLGYDENGNAIVGTPWKSITCECSNGSRVTLTRLDGTSTDNFVIDDYLYKEYGGDPPKHTREEFDEAYNMLRKDWVSMHRKFKEDYRQHMYQWADNYIEIHDDFDFKEYDLAYGKESSKFKKDFARNYDTWNGNFRFDASVFEELGFELSLEWVR